MLPCPCAGTRNASFRSHSQSGVVLRRAQPERLSPRASGHDNFRPPPDPSRVLRTGSSGHEHPWTEGRSDNVGCLRQQQTSLGVVGQVVGQTQHGDVLVTTHDGNVVNELLDCLALLA